MARPEFREARCRQPRLPQAGARRLVEILQPLADAAPLREGLPRTEALREVGKNRVRSEEHTSELQSLMRISYAVFCLKKKKAQHYNQLHPPPHHTESTLRLQEDSTS